MNKQSIVMAFVILGVFGSAILMVTVFRSPNEPIFPRVPVACILVSQEEIRDKTGDQNLTLVGEATWNEIGGSKCSWQDQSRPDTTWSFEVDPEFDSAKKLRTDEGYSLTSATSEQLGGNVPDHVYVLSKDDRTYGLLYDDHNVAITVIGPVESPLGNVYQLMLAVLDGYVTQTARGAGGQ